MNLSLLEVSDLRTSFIPNKVAKEFMSLLFAEVPESVKLYARALKDSGWKFYTVHQNRGMCYYNSRVITIPTWLFTNRRSSLSKKIWYISHELSHAYDECISNHGPTFMAWLKKICPEEHIHWELTYKPREAKRAGIGQMKLINLL